MTAGGMVDAWERALDALDAAGTPAVDGYGRRLELITLPDELLAQVDPRRVVSDGTRLPEDVESWERHVREGER